MVPVTYALPPRSTAIPPLVSLLAPPRYVLYAIRRPLAVSFVTKTSSGHGSSPRHGRLRLVAWAAFRFGKSV